MSAARYLSRLVAATAFPHGNYRHGRNRPQVETTCFRRSISRRSEGCLQTLLEEPTDELLPVGLVQAVCGNSASAQEFLLLEVKRPSVSPPAERLASRCCSSTSGQEPSSRA